MEQEVLLTFYNTHHAISAEQILLREDIPVKVMPMPSAISAGCGLCLRVPPEYRQQANHCLATEKIQVQQAYRIQEGGYIAIKD